MLFICVLFQPCLYYKGPLKSFFPLSRGHNFFPWAKGASFFRRQRGDQNFFTDAKGRKNVDDQPLQIDGPFPTKNDSSLSLETLLDPTKIKILLEWTSVPSVGMSHFPLQRRSGLNI